MKLFIIIYFTTLFSCHDAHTPQHVEAAKAQAEKANFRKSNLRTGVNIIPKDDDDKIRGIWINAPPIGREGSCGSGSRESGGSDKKSKDSYNKGKDLCKSGDSYNKTEDSYNKSRNSGISSSSSGGSEFDRSVSSATTPQQFYNASDQNTECRLYSIFKIETSTTRIGYSVCGSDVYFVDEFDDGHCARYKAQFMSNQNRAGEVTLNRTTIVYKFQNELLRKYHVEGMNLKLVYSTAVVSPTHGASNVVCLDNIDNTDCYSEDMYPISKISNQANVVCLHSQTGIEVSSHTVLAGNLFHDYALIEKNSTLKLILIYTQISDRNIILIDYNNKESIKIQLESDAAIMALTGGRFQGRITQTTAGGYWGVIAIGKDSSNVYLYTTRVLTNSSDWNFKPAKRIGILPKTVSNNLRIFAPARRDVLYGCVGTNFFKWVGRYLYIYAYNYIFVYECW